MRKQEKIIGGTLLACACLTIGILSLNDGKNFLSPVLANDGDYSLNVTADSTTFNGAGTFNYTNSRNNTFSFSYKGATESSNVITLSSLGYIKNNTALTDLSGVTVNYTDANKGIYVSYGWLDDSNNVVYRVENAQLTSGTLYSFNNDYPTFIKISAIRSVPVTSIQLSYKCAQGLSTTKDKYTADESNYSTLMASTSSSLTVQQAAYAVAHAARREGSGAISTNLLSSAGLTSSASSTLTQATAMQLLYEGFNSTMPSKVGARKFEAYDSSSTLSSTSTSASYYNGVALLSNAGLLAPLASGSTTVFSATSTMTKSQLGIYLSRLHGYYGLSIKDDFFSTVNHDYLYENCAVQDQIQTGFAYDSQLISDNKIAHWVDSKIDTIATASTTVATNVNNFNSTAFESGGHKAGTSSTSVGGLGKLVANIQAATTIAKIKTVYANMVNECGWCPLWDSLDFQAGTSVYYTIATPFNIYSSSHTTADYASGATYRTQHEADFSNRLKLALGTSSTYATIASNYMEWCHLWYAKATTYASAMTSSSYYYPSSSSATGNSTFRVYTFLKSNLSVYNPADFVFIYSGAIKATESLFGSSSNLSYIQAYSIVQTLLHFWTCLPDDCATSWIGVAPSRTGLLSEDGYYTTYYSPYIEDDLCNWYATTTEYATKESAVAAVFNNVKTYLSTRFGNESWLSSSGKTAAQNKLSAIDYNLMMSYGITSTSGSLTSSGTLSYDSYAYTSLSSGGTLYSNMAIHDLLNWTGAYRYAGYSTSGFARVESSYATTTWDDYVTSACTPLTANAFYTPSYNGFTITMGYFAAYSDVDTMSLADRLASYGWVIGHEITHGFDSSGCKYDASGSQTAIFGSTDQSAFSTKTAAVTTAYQGKEVMPAEFTNGAAQTSTTSGGVLTEATADLGGLATALDIGTGIEGTAFDYEEFFIRGAQNFSDYYSRTVYDNYIATDEHPVGRVRVNQAYGAFSKFFDTFGIKNGDDMYNSTNYYVW